MLKKEGKLSWQQLKSTLGIHALPKKVMVGRRRSLRSEMPFAFLPVKFISKKVFGERATNKAVDKMLTPIANADLAMGQVLTKGLSKVTKHGKHLFEDKVVFDIGKKGKHYTGGKEVYLPSALAPVKKVGKFVMPTLGAMKAEEYLLGDAMNKKPHIKEADLKKTAAMLDGLNKKCKILTKEAKATELLYKQAELGQIIMPRTFVEYQEKVAELLGKDLDVVEEAIKIAASSENELGGLDSTRPMGVDPRTAFQQSILD